MVHAVNPLLQYLSASTGEAAQLNSTSHPVGVADRKEVLANSFIFPNLKTVNFLLKVLIVLQSSKLTSMLFHISITL